MASEIRDRPLQPSHPKPQPPLVPRVQDGHSFALSPLEAVMVATRRQMTLAARDKVLLKGRIVQVGSGGVGRGGLQLASPFQLLIRSSRRGGGFLV